MGLNKEQIRGLGGAVAGKTKELAGKLVGDKDLEVRGLADEIVGTTLVKIGDAKEAARKAKKPR